MSFSREVKKELAGLFSEARHCQIAEIAAIMSMCGRMAPAGSGKHFVKIHTENLTVAQKYLILLKMTFRIAGEVMVRRNKGVRNGANYLVYVKGQKDCERLRKAAKLVFRPGEGEAPAGVSGLIMQNSCCKRAFIRGVFLSAGSISNPSKTYHFEIVAPFLDKAQQIRDTIHFFEVDAKIIIRKKYYVVYVKEGAQIVDLLNVMGAHQALMNLENVRILKEVRNSVNRQVNCETANINKTVAAAAKQIEDIQYIRDTIGFGKLSEGLENVARLRIRQPDVSLKELGALLNPPIGKSGVNHRLRKLSIIAENLREQKEEV